MKNHLPLFALIALLFLPSCKDDEEKINPIVGTWELDFVELPSESGFVLLTFSNTASLYGEILHEITFFADGTYERDLRFSNGKLEDNGTWELDGEDLDLDIDEADDDDVVTSFKVSGDLEDGEMFLETEISWPAVTSQFAQDLSAVIDTFTTDESYQKVLSENIQVLNIDVILEFDKQR